MDMINISRTYRPDEVAAILNVSKRQIYRWVNDPTDPLPAIKLSSGPGGHIRVKGNDLRDWMEKRKMEPWK